MELLRLTLTNSNKELTVKKRYGIEHAGGHDLVLSKDGSTLFVTTLSRVLIFDIETEKFALYQPLADLRNVKSITFHPETGRMAYTMVDPRVWWTYTVRFQNQSAAIPL